MGSKLRTDTHTVQDKLYHKPNRKSNYNSVFQNGWRAGGQLPRNLQGQAGFNKYPHFLTLITPGDAAAAIK
jgi:hypothetical protein